MHVTMAGYRCRSLKKLWKRELVRCLLVNQCTIAREIRGSYNTFSFNFKMLKGVRFFVRTRLGANSSSSTFLPELSKSRWSPFLTSMGPGFDPETGQPLTVELQIGSIIVASTAERGIPGSRDGSTYSFHSISYRFHTELSSSKS